MIARAMVAALLAPVVLAGCTESNDGDGLDPSVEAQGWVVRVTPVQGAVREYHVDSDPNVADTDGDGMNDFDELLASSDPRNIDTDGDGLLDGRILCPDRDSPVLGEIASRGIVEHPAQPGCFLGEARWDFHGVSIRTDPTSAHSDTGVGIDDGLNDAEEILGWDVTVGGRTYHTFSNPSIGSADTDGDGVSDGNERILGTDPRNQDTDGDLQNDARDAAPLGNLVIAVVVENVNLKQDQQLTGGARLKVQAIVEETTAVRGPHTIDSGSNNVNLRLVLDVVDQASSFSELGSGAGIWAKDIHVLFYHSGTAGDQPLAVNSGDRENTVRVTFDAFNDDRTTTTTTARSSGSDADVRLRLTATIE